ncbi:hypothetical protein Tco_1539943 [Tanacetum coccineum]
MLKKYGLGQCDVVDIPMVGQSKLDEDPNETPVDPTRYRGLVGGIPMYPHSHRPGLVFAICMCAQYQANPTEKHLTMVKYVVSKGHPILFSLKHFFVVRCRDHAVAKFKKQLQRIVHISQETTQQVENGVVEIYFVKTDYQLVDIFTKALTRERFEILIKRLDMQSIPLEELKRLVESDEE